ncbi:MAG: hypothetical protein KJN85_17255 [Maribacter sp.]|nr:hypothetical protein [Maribacter sp.]
MIHRSLIILILLLGCRHTAEKQKNTDIAIDEDAIACVQMVFEKDSILGEIRNHSPEKISLSESIDNYTHELESMDFTHCPEKFRSSFNAHIKAWQQLRSVTDKYPSMRGELHDIFARLKKSGDSTEFKALVQKVWDTWDLVKENSN